MIVVDIAPREYKLEHYALVEAMTALQIDKLTSRNEADTLLSKSIADLDVRQFLLKNLQRKNDGGFTWKVNLPVIREKLGNIGLPLLNNNTFNKPTLFIRGARSKYVSDGDWENIIRIFPQATLQTLDSGHWVQAEKPKEFVETVLGWLK